MSGAATTAEWLACSGIGCGAGAVVLGLLKLALDHDALASPDAQQRHPTYQPPPALPARAPVRRPRHAAPLLVDETQPIRRVQPPRARHAKEAA